MSRSFCYTLNNPTDEDTRAVHELTLLCSTHICGLEHAEPGSTGTPHYQGVCVFRSPKRFAALKRLLPRAHWEICRDLEGAKDYCRKENKMIVDVDGDDHRGRRTDLEVLHEALRDGGLKRAREVCPCSLIKYPTGSQLFVSLNQAEDRSDFRVLVFTGLAGTGKTQAARTYPDAWFWSQGPWFDTYTGQSTIILDEFLGIRSGLPLSLFLRLADRYALMLPVKGGFTPALHRLLIITSNTPWMNWYPDADNAAMRRRLEHDIGTTYDKPPYPHYIAPN